MSDRPTRSRVNWIKLLKRLLLIVVLGIVLWQIVEQGRKIDWNSTRLRPAWLVSAAAVYLLGWFPCLWYWRKLIAAQGTLLSWPLVIRAHFCGQLGKYVPGKAAALLIRAEMVRPAGVPLVVGLLTAGFESLATMAVGAAVAASLAPFAVSPDEWTTLGVPHMAYPLIQSLMLSGVILLALLFIPLLSRLLNLVLRKIIAKVVTTPLELRDIRPPLWSFLPLALTWWLHGLSLGCTIQGVGADIDLLSLWPRWTAAASLGTVIGFVVLFAPGGAGVREGVLLILLQGTLGPQAALVVVLLRLIWLVAELVAAALCLVLLRPPKFPPSVET